MVWIRQPVIDLLASFDLSSVLIDGCAFGMNHKGESIKKHWKIVTDQKQLAENLAPWKCPGDHKHKEISGALMPKTVHSNNLMCWVILNSLFPFMMSSHIPAMACSPTSSSSFPPKRD